jgi:hypothetical protein
MPLYTRFAKSKHASPTERCIRDRVGTLGWRLLFRACRNERRGSRRAQFLNSVTLDGGHAGRKRSLDKSEQ